MWERLKNGESGVGYTTVFDASNFPTKISAEVRDWDVSRSGRRSRGLEVSGPAHAASPSAPPRRPCAIPASTRPVDPTRFGVYLGSGEGQQDFHCFTRMMTGALDGDAVRPGAVHQGRARKCCIRSIELEQEPNMPAGHLAGLFNAQGPNANCLTACAASSQAIGEAVEIIRRGDADVMLSGGTHSMIHPFGVTGFNLLTALSTNNEHPHQGLAAVRSRPRRLRAGRRGRDGRARRVGACPARAARRSTAKSRGYGSTADAFRITDTHPEGAAPCAASAWPWKTPA